tara:strand:+ start:3090 stop:5963 length:2874 start_codon:yes stop_codon:yes gene_type:complete
MTEVADLEKVENLENLENIENIENIEDNVNVEPIDVSENSATVIEEVLPTIIEEEVKHEPEIFEFGADINQLLTLIINTFYSNKDIFLRELISNSSDALNKIRHESLTNADALKHEPQLNIRISMDADNNTITITDTGIGMTKNDLINNLGTIAKSGTKAFMESLASSKDVNMIGQFGVGFYSAYLVADKVSVTSKHNDDDQYTWASSAGGKYTIVKDSPSEKLDIGRGTKMVLTLKENMKDYTNPPFIQSLIKKHSEFISFPIQLSVEKEDDDAKIEDVTKEVVRNWQTVNNQDPIWVRTTDDISQEEYAEFYKSITGDYDEHAGVKHFKIEGNLDFKALLFAPRHDDVDMFGNTQNTQSNIKLYVRHVLIMENCADLMPQWLSFMKGLVDSEDLPLNISREILQQNKVLKVIKKSLIKKSIELFSEMSENKEKYNVFYNAFSKNLKIGIHEEKNYKEKLASLLRYHTSKSDGSIVSLNDYISNMKPAQEGIYYISGESLEVLKSSPFTEKLKQLDYEIVYMTDPIDEYTIQEIKDFKGKKLISVAQSDVDLNDDTEKKEFEVLKKQNVKLCNTIKEILDSKLEKVVISPRLNETPCILVSGDHGWTGNMERIMKAQALNNDNGARNLKFKKIMEINPKNKIMVSLSKHLKQGNTLNKTIKDLVWLLYDTALLNSGFSLEQPKEFSNRIHNLIELGLDNNDETEDNINIENTVEEYGVEEEVEDENEMDINDKVNKLAETIGDEGMDKITKLMNAGIKPDSPEGSKQIMEALGGQQKAIDLLQEAGKLQGLGNMGNTPNEEKKKSTPNMEDMMNMMGSEDSAPDMENIIKMMSGMGGGGTPNMEELMKMAKSVGSNPDLMKMMGGLGGSDDGGGPDMADMMKMMGGLGGGGGGGGGPDIAQMMKMMGGLGGGGGGCGNSSCTDSNCEDVIKNSGNDYQTGPGGPSITEIPSLNKVD